MNTEYSEQPQATRLESWKEIGAYLQRDVRTMRRWEREEGLPIHRHSHKSRSSVYAYTGEIDVWRASRKAAVETQPARSLWRLPAFAMTVLMCLIMAGSGIRPEAASAQQQRPVTKRLVFSSGGIDRDATFTPDGKRMVFWDWNDSQDLAIRDLSTGKITRMLAKPLTPADSDAYAQIPVLSPDQRQIAYFWDPGGKDSQIQLRIMPNKPGGKSRALIDGNIFPVAWFPDGKSILALRVTNRRSQIERVLVADGASKVLKSLEWRLVSVTGRQNLSPDGRYIVYSALTVNPAALPTKQKQLARNPIVGDRHIYVLSADGTTETEIVKTSGNNQNPVWTPDGKHILFTSDRSGKVDLWSIAMQNGKAAGEPSLVRAEIGDIYAFGIYRGSFYYEHRQPPTNYVHVVETVPGGGVRELERFVGMAPSWSPDGKSIAFKRRHPGIEDAYDLVVHSTETGNERTIPTSLGTSGNGAPQWFHDGNSLRTGFGHTGPRAPYRIDLQTGEFKEIRTGGQFSLDDKTAYVVRREAGKPDRVMAVDLNTGQERQILDSPAVGENQGLAIALSPDGRTLALVWLGRGPSEGGAKLHVARVSVDGNDYREVFTRQDTLFGGGAVAWSRDGRSILFRQEQPGGAAQWGVMRVPADGSAPATLVFATPPLCCGFDPNPDDRRFAYGSRESPDELWALDNILSALK